MKAPGGFIQVCTVEPGYNDISLYNTSGQMFCGSN